MTIIQTENFIIPNDPATIKKIKDACFEISASMSRTEGEKSFIKEAIAALSDDTDIPKKHLNKIARLFHRSNKDAVEAENEATSELYDRIFSQENVHATDETESEAVFSDDHDSY